MRKCFAIIFLALICLHSLHSLETGCLANVQDVPINYQKGPLEGWPAFIVSPLYSLSGPQNEELRNQCFLVIKKELQKIGKIIEVDVGDITKVAGIGAILNLTFDTIMTWDKKRTEYIRATLTLQAESKINKTQVECLSYIWSSNAFAEGDMNKKNLLGCIERLLESFSSCFLHSNHKMPITPTFYIYK